MILQLRQCQGGSDLRPSARVQWFGNISKEELGRGHCKSKRPKIDFLLRSQNLGSKILLILYFDPHFQKYVQESKWFV
jgi:hypothetical protein